MQARVVGQLGVERRDQHRALPREHRLAPELGERLEQLRFLEHGIPITVVETDEPTIGVDTETDLRAVEALLRTRGA